MTIGTPVSAGTASISNSATISVTTTVNIPAGALIVVMVGTRLGHATGVSDGTNTYSAATTAGIADLYYSNNIAAQLNSGSTITATISGTSSVVQMGVLYVTGIATSSPLDNATASSGGPGTNATVLTGTATTSASEIIFASFSVLVNIGTRGAVAGPPTYTAAVQLDGAGGSFSSECWYSIITSALTPQMQASWTGGTSANWGQSLVSFVGAAVSQPAIPPDVSNPVRLTPSTYAVRAHEERPKLTLIGKDVLFGVPGEPPTPAYFPNPVLAKPNLELRTFFQPTDIYFPMPVPVKPVDAPNPIPRRWLVEYPTSPNRTLLIPVFPFVPFYCENPRRPAFRDAVVCNAATPLDIIPPFKVKAPDNPRGPRSPVEHPIPPNVLASTLAPGTFPFWAIYGNPFFRNAAETLRLGEALSTNILGIIQQPAPPPDFPNPRGYPYPTGITSDPGFQSLQSLDLVAIQPIGGDTFPTDLPIRATPSFINFDAAPTNLLSGTLLPQPLPPGDVSQRMSDLPPRGYIGYSQYEAGSPNATATTLQTVFPPPGIPYPYEELYQYFARPGLSFTAYMEGSKGSPALGGALNVPPISDQLLDYFFATIASRTAYAFMYGAGPPSLLGTVLAPVSAPPGDLYVKQHRMGAPGFPLMGEPH